MALKFRNALKTLGAAAIAPVLAGCGSMAPGMHFASPASSSSGSYEATGDSSSSAADTEAMELKKITPHLIKVESEMRKKEASDDISALLSKPAHYTIDAGDLLSIVVWDHPELTNPATGNANADAAGNDLVAATLPPAGFAVDQEGMIQFPFAGMVKVAGLTSDQASQLLAKKLAKYIRKPRVTLRVQAYRSKRVYVDGEVKTPGLLSLNDIPMTLMEAINRAGGILPETGDQSQIIVNRDGKNYHINLLQLVQRGINPNSIMLKNGDIVRVRSRNETQVFVSGEVVQPRALTMHNGSLTLNEALGDAGGVNPVSGDGSQIYVVRNVGSKQMVYQLDGSSPGALAMAENFHLKPKDVVYVAATPLANWHRAISLLLPSALSGAVGAVGTVSPAPGR